MILEGISGFLSGFILPAIAAILFEFTIFYFSEKAKYEHMKETAIGRTSYTSAMITVDEVDGDGNVTATSPSCDIRTSNQQILTAQLPDYLTIQTAKTPTNVQNLEGAVTANYPTTNHVDTTQKQENDETKTSTTQNCSMTTQNVTPEMQETGTKPTQTQTGTQFTQNATPTTTTTTTQISRTTQITTDKTVDMTRTKQSDEATAIEAVRKMDKKKTKTAKSRTK